MSFNNSLKSGIKKLRRSQPFNRFITSGTRSVLSLLGLRSEFVIRHLHRVDLVETRLPTGEKLRLWSKGDDWISNQVFWRDWHGYEPETVPIFFRLAQQAEVTLDIGAHVGFFTILAAHANKNGKVFAFEPLPAIYRRLQLNVSLNDLQNVETIPAALGAEEGELDFFYQSEQCMPTGSTLSYEHLKNYSKNRPGLAKTKVRVSSLDKFTEEKNLERVDLMKIDTETTEADVLRGARSLLERSHPNIICEVLEIYETGKQLEEILRPLGYKFYLLTPDGAVEREHVEGHPDFLNYLFTPLNPEELSKFQ